MHIGDEFVVYQNARAFPMFAVYYTTKSAIPSCPTWIQQGALVKHGSKVGEVLTAPDSDKKVKVCWSDGTTSGWIVRGTLKAAELAQPSIADQRSAASWCTRGTRAKFQGKIGTVLSDEPDSDAEVRMKFEDGSESGFIKAVRVHPLSAEEVAADEKATAEQAAAEKKAAAEMDMLRIALRVVRNCVYDSDDSEDDNGVASSMYT
eukprot:COSAG02_NODE_2269_length_9270_cov_17.410642_3_plen_205_part_00